MTPRSLFSIIIKVLGIYLILASFNVFPQSITALFYISTNGGGDIVSTILMGLFILLTLIIFYLIVRYCIFRTDLIIDKLHLDKGFEEEKFELNIHRSTVLSIAVIVIGGIMIVDALPGLCQQVYSYVRMKTMGFSEDSNVGWLIFYVVKFFIGCILLTKSRIIVNFIEKQRKN